MIKNVLVWGWFNHKNIGDELFKEAFKTLFPQHNFIFTDTLTSDNTNNADAIFFGGGSFLDCAIPTNLDLDKLSQDKKIFYIGVGSETDIHPNHLPLIKAAQLIAIRNNNGLEKMQKLNKNVILIPDLVYSLNNKIVFSPKIEKSLLFIPNTALVPRNNDPHWMFSAWDYFKSEVSQFLDLLITDNYKINFLSMCNDRYICDDWAAIEIINQMQHRDSDYLLPHISDIQKISLLFSQYQIIITQRFHGIILSEMTNVPYLAFYHHDKLKLIENNLGRCISYYNVSKQKMLDEFYSLKNISPKINKRNLAFTELQDRVMLALSE